MRLVCVLQRRRGPTDDRAQGDERRLVGHGQRGVERVRQGLHVLFVLAVVSEPVDPLGMPAVGGIPGLRVLGERDVGVVLDGDVVVIPDQHQVAQPLGGGERGRLRADPLLEVTVGGDAPDGVVERAGAGVRVGVEQPALAARGHGHADRVADALTERTGGGLHPDRVAVLRVAGRLRPPRAQRLQVGQLEAVAGQVQLDVQRQARMPGGEHEAVPSGPVRVSRVVPQVALPQQVRGRREAHRRPGVAVAHLLDGVHGQHPNRVHDLAVEIGPVQRHRRWCSFRASGLAPLASLAIG